VFVASIFRVESKPSKKVFEDIVKKEMFVPKGEKVT
jgi:hypothetical protein